jgi:hypothetical protein
MKEKEFIKVFGKDVKVGGHLIQIAQLDGEIFTFPDDPEVVLDSLRKCGRRIDLFTFLQRLTETSPKYTFPMEWDNLAALPVSTFDNWWTQQIGSKVRNQARLAEKKGVVLREIPFDDALLRGICSIYNETPIRQGRRFPHYGMGLDRAREYAGTFLDRSIFIGAFLGERMIGFAKLVTDETRTQACAIHILSMLRHRDKAPTNALIAQAVRSCAERRISYLVYDKFSYGKKQRDSLSDFKERNGFQKFQIPRYYVPLTEIGRVALRLGMHNRPFVDYLPEPVMAKLRAFRAAWYNRKFGAVS